MSERDKHFENIRRIMADMRQKVLSRRLARSSSNCHSLPLKTRSSSQCPPSTNLNRLQKELMDISINPPPLCCARLKNHDDLYEWIATIQGPKDSVYRGGVFTLNFRFPKQYPLKPPAVKFITRIYHCNVNQNGTICLDILNKKWKPDMTVSSILLSVCSLLSDCNPVDALVPSIGCLYLKNRKEHDRNARLYTRKFASSKVLSLGYINYP